MIASTSALPPKLNPLEEAGELKEAGVFCWNIDVRQSKQVNLYH